MMPKISGFEMLDILRNTENLKTVPVIMLTALGQNDDQQRADKLGADRYLVKSQVTLEDIVKVTHELLGDDPAAAEPEAAASPSPVETAATASATPAPAPDPAPAPAPEAVATPPAETPEVVPDQPQPAPASDDAVATAAKPVEKTPVQTIAQEGAAVEARIEDFVTGATEDATPPAEVAEPAIDSTTESSTKPDEEPKPADAATNDEPAVDKEAVDEAVQSIEIKSEPTPTPAAEPVTAPAAEEDATSTSVNAEAPSATPTSPTASTVVHDKVITPLEADPKKDIKTLLALEAVKEANNKPPGPQAGEAVIVTNDQAPATPAPAASSTATALGANPTPSSIIAPVETDEDTPAITQSASSVTAPPATEDPGADLNGIAI